MCSKSEGKVCVCLVGWFSKRSMVILDHKQICNGSNRDRVLGSWSPRSADRLAQGYTAR